jgi:hypothetical protein
MDDGIISEPTPANISVVFSSAEIMDGLRDDLLEERRE